MIEIYQDFRFEAAHHFPEAGPKGHPYTRVHGHSFRARVYLRGIPDPATGWIADLGNLEEALLEAKEVLDHSLLNGIPGLDRPSLENIAIWIWECLKPKLPSLQRIEVHRDSCGHGCVYDGTV